MDAVSPVRSMAEERPLLEGPVPMLALLAVGELGVLQEPGPCASPSGWAWSSWSPGASSMPADQRWAWLPALAAGAINGLFGLLIVVLEVLVH
jgi:hypothetical protein